MRKTMSGYKSANKKKSSNALLFIGQMEHRFVKRTRFAWF
jgi:hypothetical protein